MLINRNIFVGGQRTSIRLEPAFWVAFGFIAEREHVSIDELCTEIDPCIGHLSRTAAIRVFINSYMMEMSQLFGKSSESQIEMAASDRPDCEIVSESSPVFRRHRVGG